MKRYQEENESGRGRLGWAKLPVVGAAIGLGLLFAWQRRNDPKRRIAKMNADHPVGRSRGTSHGRTDDVAEKMSEASSL